MLHIKFEANQPRTKFKLLSPIYAKAHVNSLVQLLVDKRVRYRVYTTHLSSNISVWVLHNGGHTFLDVGDEAVCNARLGMHQSHAQMDAGITSNLAFS